VEGGKKVMRIDDIKYILIYPETHEHLGLFRDLQDKKNVELIVARQRNLRNPVIKAIKRINLSWIINQHISLPYKKKWYEKISVDVASNKQYCVIVVDAALRALEVGYLNSLFHKNNVRGVLMLINSMDAQSIGIQEVKPDIKKINWDDIYTFDASDVMQYGFKSLGNCYYSMHDQAEIEKKYPDAKASDVYFIGGIKGGREELVLNVFEKMHNAGVDVTYNVMLFGIQKLKEKKFEGLIHYYSGSWIPYERVLADVLKTNVIVEIMQEHQYGPSLRYYEAVCYNKKLLTNNVGIKDLPFYDSRYMKIFSDVNEIDIDWVLAKEPIDYGYDGSFSPINMINTIENK
jgi:hypothetical protein